ncbi:MAG: PAS domain S-box protein [Dehalococcoidia bacterium]|nr:PAS domain S-box protein [Dehalococcoidia bacterium]
MRDVTERRRAERDLRRNEERFRDLFQNAADSIYTMALDGRFLAVNAAMAESLGYSEEELLQMRVEDIAPPSNAPAFRAAFEMKQRGELSTTYHIDLRRRDGSVLTAEVTSRFITNEHGETVAIQGIARDVTERVEEEREVREREERIRNVLETMPCAVCISDGERLLHWNAALRTFSGYGDEEHRCARFSPRSCSTTQYHRLPATGPRFGLPGPRMRAPIACPIPAPTANSAGGRSTPRALTMTVRGGCWSSPSM